jgi:hypothetical protein
MYSYEHLPLYVQGSSPQYLCYRRLGWLRVSVEVMEKTLFLCLKWNPDSLVI